MFFIEANPGRGEPAALGQFSDPARFLRRRLTFNLTLSLIFKRVNRGGSTSSSHIGDDTSQGRAVIPSDVAPPLPLGSYTPMMSPTTMPQMMEAFVLKAYGGPEHTVLEEVPVPKTGSRQLLVKVRAAGLNPVDYGTRKGRLRPIQPYRLPAVLGNELAGEVVTCGDQVRRFRVGDRVFARVAKNRMGAFAQFAIVEENHAAVIPASLNFETAAAIPLAGLTALQALRDELHVASGQRIFISGGAGGVGSFAIQIAKHLGVQVATTASPRGEALVRQLGADMVIDYTQERPASVLSGFDGAFDLIGGDTLKQAIAIVRPGATVVSVAGMPEPTASKDSGAWALVAGAVLGCELFPEASRPQVRSALPLPLHASQRRGLVRTGAPRRRRCGEG